MLFIRRFMLAFGLFSSVFDYVTFRILLLVLHVQEKVFQTGWFIEPVISAILIVLVVPTRLYFFKSLPGKFLSAVAAFILVVALILPLKPLSPQFGFDKIPLRLYSWMLLVVIGYVIDAENAKKWIYHKISKVN